MKLYILLFVAVFALSCTSSEKRKKDTDADKPGTLLDLDGRLAKTDSMVVVFYRDPYGKDSLRYTRFYTQVALTDTPNLARLKDQLSTPVNLLQQRKSCRTEGKIWCFQKGKIFQTVYFNTKCDGNCCFLYIIKDGNFYYAAVSDLFTQWLAAIKLQAKEA